MAGGYKHRPDGIEGLSKLVVDLQRQINEMRSASPLMNAVLRGGEGVTVYDPSTGSRMQFVDGQMRLWGDYDANPENFGLIMVDPGVDINYMRMFPPFTDGSGQENSITVRGRREGEPGHVWVYTDSRTDIIGPLLGLYELPTTGAAANLTLGYVGSEWTVALSTSSERYKTDIAPVEVDTDELLELTGITWVHNDSMDSAPEGDIRRNVGWHAEQIDTKPSLRQFVNYDEQGRPDSVEDSRMSVALLELCKSQQTQIDDLTRRLEALEGNTP